MSSRQGDDNWIVVPSELVSSFYNWGTGLEQLQQEHPWLQELDKEPEDFSELRHEFLTDGGNFLATLDRFLRERKWYEFVLQTCTASGEYRPLLLEILKSAGHGRQGAQRVAPTSATRSTDVLEACGVETEKETFCGSFFEAIKARCDEPTASEVRGGIVENVRVREDSLISNVAGTVNMRRTDAQKLLWKLQDQIQGVSNTHAEVMKFEQSTCRGLDEPQLLRDSHHWKRIGRNLWRLASLVGADTSRRSAVENGSAPVTALKSVVNNQGPAVKIMLARIEQKQALIERQQRVIAALQFRHLLEHLPRDLRGTAVPAEEWDRMNESERWFIFWQEAVRQVYRVWKEHDGNAAWAPSGRKPSPFAELLQDSLAKRDNDDDDDEDAAVTWLANETKVGKRMKNLHSTLSEVIDQFSDGNFTANQLTFSPVDTQLLEALTPESSQWEGTNWEKEHRRYIFSIYEAETRVQRFWRSFQPNDTTPKVLPGELKSLSVRFHPTRITTIYKPVDTHVQTNGFLRNDVLNALVASVGRMTLAAAELHAPANHAHARGLNLAAVRPGDELAVSCVASQRQDFEGHWLMTVKIKVSEDGRVGEVAGGEFEAWGARKWEAAE